MLDALRIYFFVFGVLTIVGGVMGFVRAKSTPSLIAGVGSGLCLLFAGFLMSRDLVQIGVIGGIVVSVALAGRFVPAYLKTKKAMPAGLIAALSLVGILLGVLGLLQLSK